MPVYALGTGFSLFLSLSRSVSPPLSPPIAQQLSKLCSDEHFPGCVFPSSEEFGRVRQSTIPSTLGSGGFALLALRGDENSASSARLKTWLLSLPGVQICPGCCLFHSNPSPSLWGERTPVRIPLWVWPNGGDVRVEEKLRLGLPAGSPSCSP